MAMTIKNNFANLNLVKTFLTSITFDSLSRKIKNPCLVINKNSFLRRIFMKNIKQFFTYVVVGALVMALSISCKNDDKTGSEANTGSETRTLSYYAGDWWVSFEGGEQHLFTINADGSVIIYGDPDTITIPSTDITKNSDTSYTYYDATANASLNFNFTSDTKVIVVAGTSAFNATKK